MKLETKSTEMEFDLSDTSSMTFSLEGDANVTFNVETPNIIGIDEYEGEYVVVPKTYSQTLLTTDKLMRNDVTITEVPYFETSNEDGTTVYIANTIA